MAITAADLQSRFGNVVRVKISYPTNPTAPETEYEARVGRVWPDQRIAEFYIGCTTIHIGFEDIVSLTGGLQSADGPRNTLDF